VTNTIVRPKVLKFKSEYELVKGTSPIQDPNIVVCKDKRERVQMAMHDVTKLYEAKPIIVIHDNSQRDQLQQIAKANKLKHVFGVCSDHLQQIKAWEYGILFLLANEARGVDTRFAKDAFVVIVADLTSYQELLQMVGRSSRSRGTCESNLYIDTQESQSQVMERLRRHNVVALQDMEKVLKIFERRHRDQQIVAAVKKALDDHRIISSLADL
jgi:hypothetical protein